MKPILYHFYCLKSISGPDSNYDIEIDHIIPQALFSQTAIENRELLKDNILNLGLLPKGDNISKGKRRLIEIQPTEEWLKEQIEKYEFVDRSEFDYYSNVNNYREIYERRKGLFTDAFGTNRDIILNN